MSTDLVQRLRAIYDATNYVDAREAADLIEKQAKLLANAQRIINDAERLLAEGRSIIQELMAERNAKMAP